MKIHDIRERKGISQATLAKGVGVTQGYISHLETGRCENPSLIVLLKIAEILGVSLEELINERKKAV